MIGLFHFRMKQALILTALAAASAASVANADDSSLNPFTGESYSAFNGANRPAIANPPFDEAPSVWREQNPGGLSERVFQSYSAPGENWHLSAPDYADAPAVASFHASHPGGLTEQELQALSSDGDAWQMRASSGAGSASADSAATAQAEPLRQRFARAFHPTVAQ
jgi:hypothetical protein